MLFDVFLIRLANGGLSLTEVSLSKILPPLQGRIPKIVEDVFGDSKSSIHIPYTIGKLLIIHNRLVD